MKLKNILIPALLLIAPIGASASQSLQVIPPDIDISSAEVSRGYLDAQLGSTFMRELLEGDESRFRDRLFTGAGISWHRERQLSLAAQYRSSPRIQPHRTMRPDLFWDDYQPELSAFELAFAAHVRGGFGARTQSDISLSEFFIRKPDLHRFYVSYDHQSVKFIVPEEASMNVVGMLVSIQYGPEDFPRPIETMNELKYMNANMIFASWAFNNKELLPD